jgi:hypothetical protein
MDHFLFSSVSTFSEEEQFSIYQSHHFIPFHFKGGE